MGVVRAGHRFSRSSFGLIRIIVSCPLEVRCGHVTGLGSELEE